MLFRSIALVSTSAFALACCLEGSVQYSMQLCLQESDLCSAFTTPETTDLSRVPLDYHDFADIFSKSKANMLAPHCEHDLKINLEDSTFPSLGATYSLSSSKLSSLCEFLDKHLAMGFICPSSSTHATPVLFVCKKDSSLCLCVNFRGLNKITKKDKVYTKIDLRHAYHLVHIADGDEWKTSFWTCYSSYKWLVMPFGFTNTLAAFQHFVNTVFADLLDVWVIVYLDNILIYSTDMASHKKHVQEVLW